jgi:hypothetical protein
VSLASDDSLPRSEKIHTQIKLNIPTQHLQFDILYMSTSANGLQNWAQEICDNLTEKKSEILIPETT